MTDDVGKSHNKRRAILGPWSGGNIPGMHSYDEKGKFFLFLNIACLDHNLIAHEVLHMTHRTLEYCGHEISSRNHEPHAFVCGYITQVVYQSLKKWRIPVAICVKP